MNNQYSLNADRRNTERRLTAYSVRFPELIDRLPIEKISSEPLKIICNQIKALKNKDIVITEELLESYAVPRMINSKINEDVCQKAVQKIFQISKSIENSSLFSHHLAKLKEVESKYSILSLSDILKKRVEEGDDVKKICAIGNELLEIGTRNSVSLKSVSIGDAFESLMDNINESLLNDASIGVDYPIKCLSRALGTMYPTDLVVIAARPAVGKTAFGINLCRFTDEPMGFISSEMAKEQLAMRVVSMDAGIPTDRIRNVKSLSKDELEKISECATRHKGRKLYIEEKGSINIGEIEEISESWVNLHGVKVIVVDYVQRLNSDRKHQTDAERIGHITKRLKELAKRLGICVVLLAQINRDSVKGDRRPELHDIKGSGDIEQEADSIILMHKPSMGSDEANRPTPVEFIIPKNRHGKVGMVVTEYIPQYVTFKDPSESFMIEHNYRVAA